jgi:hypothetical protein
MSLRTRMRVEFALAGVGVVLTVLSLVWPTWWESAFESSPDAGSGSWERLLALVWLIAAGGFALAGRRDLRGLQASAVPPKQQAVSEGGHA